MPMSTVAPDLIYYVFDPSAAYEAKRWEEYDDLDNAIYHALGAMQGCFYPEALEWTHDPTGILVVSVPRTSGHPGSEGREAAYVLLHSKVRDIIVDGESQRECDLVAVQQVPLSRI